MPVYLYARAFLSWGFSVRPVGLSAGGPSLPVPPPSTLVGAVAAGVGRLLGWGEVYWEERARDVASTAYKLAKHLLAVGARISGPVAVFRDIVKYSTLPYQSPDNIKDPGQWFGAQNFGATLAPGSALEFVIVFDDSVKDLGVDPRVLMAAAYSITRIGSKESLVAVDYAESGKAEESRGGETAMYAPMDCVDPSGRHSYYVVEAWNPKHIGAYTRRHPFSPPALRLAVPGREFGAIQVYAPEEEHADEQEVLRLRGDCTSYEGEWPGQLGRVAGLPGAEAS